MREREVLSALEALEAAGVRAWVAGGWGIDALVGRRTRLHTDLDLVLDAAADPVPPALEALAALGIRYVDEDAVGGPWFPVLVKVTDRAGRMVDLLPMERGALPPDAFATGTIGGRAVGCLSPSLQVAFHCGYHLSRAVRRDVARLRTRFGLVVPPPPPGPIERIWRRALWRGRRLRRRVRRVRREPHPSESSLVIPVPAADPVVPRSRERSEAARTGIPSHITVLYPFIPPDAIDDAVERAIASILAGFTPFRFRLDRVERFPGALYLAPEPVEPFVALTEALWAHWPEHPPYDGAYDTVIPHLTVFDGEEPPGVAEVIEGALPIEGEAREMWLMVEGADGRWTTRRRFPLTG
jgi:hypothetical protein